MKIAAVWVLEEGDRLGDWPGVIGELNGGFELVEPSGVGGRRNGAVRGGLEDQGEAVAVGIGEFKWEGDDAGFGESYLESGDGRREFVFEISTKVASAPEVVRCVGKEEDGDRGEYLSEMGAPSGSRMRRGSLIGHHQAIREESEAGSGANETAVEGFEREGAKSAKEARWPTESTERSL